MARWLLVVFVAGCASLPQEGQARPSALEVTRGNENEGPAEVAPIEPVAFDTNLLGRWALTHGGIPWLDLEVRLEPGLAVSVLRFEPAGAWTEFRIVRVKLTEGGLDLLGDYDDFDVDVEIHLTRVGSALEGVADGPSYYGSPSLVTGTRLP
jgi:hypothetical protein